MGPRHQQCRVYSRRKALLQQWHPAFCTYSLCLAKFYSLALFWTASVKKIYLEPLTFFSHTHDPRFVFCYRDRHKQTAKRWFIGWNITKGFFPCYEITLSIYRGIIFHLPSKYRWQTLSSRTDAMQTACKSWQEAARKLMKCSIVFSYSVHSAPLSAKHSDGPVSLSLNKNPLFLPAQSKSTVCSTVLMVSHSTSTPWFKTHGSPGFVSACFTRWKLVWLLTALSHSRAPCR